MATIGWIDFSPQDRNRVGSVLDMLKPEGMVDELGLGTIRDSISNQLFPGISTIQTRAKYFFIIPYILRDYSKLKPSERRAKKASKFLEEKEYEVMWQLAEKYNFELGTGVIGITKRKPAKILRRPSAIYWTGLNIYDFIDSKGLSVEDFLNKSMNSSLESLLSLSTEDEEEKGDDKDAVNEELFRIKVPVDLDWHKDLSLDLNKKEAEFFRDHIILKSEGKLIAELLNNKKLWEFFLKTDNFMDFANVSVLTAYSKPKFLPENIKNIMILGHDFSQIMNGAHITYNCLLQDKVFNKNCFDENWKKWLENIQTSMLDFKNFNEEKIFGITSTTRITTVDFVRNWWKMIQNNFDNLGDRELLIENQEAIVKGPKARLKWNKVDDVLEKKWMGISFFDYRFNQAKIILQDIKAGLEK